LAGTLPIFALALAAILTTHRPWAAASFGGAAVASGIVFLWFGQGPQRAVLPGLMAGLVPLALALCANHVHSCGPEGCTSYCVPACTVGGIVAGLAVAAVGLKRRERIWFWLSASGLAVLVGGMGCSCVGGAGVVGLLSGYAAGVVPGLLRRLTQRLRQTG
jgi:hypothetical protein